MLLGSKRDPEDRIVPRSVDADDSDVDIKSDNDDRYVLPFLSSCCSSFLCYKFGWGCTQCFHAFHLSHGFGNMQLIAKF